MIRRNSFKQGEPLKASDLEAIRKEVVKEIKVASPLQMTTTNAGTFISIADLPGSAGKLLRVRKGDNGEDFPTLKEHLDLSSGAQYNFQCSEVYTLNNSGATSTGEDDEDKWLTVRNLAREWIPQDTILHALKLADEWVTFWRRQPLPMIFIKGEVAAVGSLPGSGEFSIDVETCSWGILQEFIEVDAEEITVSVENFHGWYVDAGNKATAIGYPRHTTANGVYNYYEQRTDLYDAGQFGNFVETILGNYDFTAVSLGCGSE